MVPKNQNKKPNSYKTYNYFNSIRENIPTQNTYFKRKPFSNCFLKVSHFLKGFFFVKHQTDFDTHTKLSILYNEKKNL